MSGGVDYSFECTGNVDVLREAFLSTQAVTLLQILSFEINNLICLLDQIKLVT